MAVNGEKRLARRYYEVPFADAVDRIIENRRKGGKGRNDVAKMSPNEAADWLVRQIEEGRQLKAANGRRTPDAGSYKKLSREGEKEKSQETSELSPSRGRDPGRNRGHEHGRDNAVSAVLKSLETGRIVANAPKEVKGLLNNRV